MTVTGKFQYYLSMVTLLGAFCLILTLVMWLIYPYKTTEFYNLPFGVDKLVYHAGDSIHVRMDFERFTSAKTTVNFRFVDGITFPLVPVSGPLLVNTSPRKFKGVIIPPIQIPVVLPKGKYSLDICYTYEVNPIRTITKNVRTQEFEVR